MTDEKAGWEVEGFIDRLTKRDDTNSERLVLEAISHLRAFSRDCDGLRKTNADLRAEIERLTAALGGLLKFCDVTSKAETDWERAVAVARAALAGKP